MIKKRYYIFKIILKKNQRDLLNFIKKRYNIQNKKKEYTKTKTIIIFKDKKKINKYPIKKERIHKYIYVFKGTIKK